VYFIRGSLSLSTMLGLDILAHLYFFSRVFSRVQRCATVAISASASQIYTHVFYLWKSIDLDSVWVKDFRPFISFLHSRVFARLAMRQTRVFGVGIPNSAYGAL